MLGGDVVTVVKPTGAGFTSRHGDIVVVGHSGSPFNDPKGLNAAMPQSSVENNQRQIDYSP